MQIAKLPDIDEGTWADVKAYVESRSELKQHPKAAKVADFLYLEKNKFVTKRSPRVNVSLLEKMTEEG